MNRAPALVIPAEAGIQGYSWPPTPPSFPLARESPSPLPGLYTVGEGWGEDNTSYPSCLSCPSM